jgi:hypothetical protein
MMASGPSFQLPLAHLNQWQQTLHLKIIRSQESKDKGFFIASV